jgi:uncharacterized Ntn-hydrolase superfamily protein
LQGFDSDEEHRMTWSIVARDDSGALGVAVASRFFAVGALCVHARSGVGTLATQALVNPGYGQAGLDLMAQRHEPAQVIEALIAADAGRDHTDRATIESEIERFQANRKRETMPASAR